MAESMPDASSRMVVELLGQWPSEATRNHCKYDFQVRSPISTPRLIPPRFSWYSPLFLIFPAFAWFVLSASSFSSLIEFHAWLHTSVVSWRWKKATSFSLGLQRAWALWKWVMWSLLESRAWKRFRFQWSGSRLILFSLAIKASKLSARISIDWFLPIDYIPAFEEALTYARIAKEVDEVTIQQLFTWTILWECCIFYNTGQTPYKAEDLSVFELSRAHVWVYRSRVLGTYLRSLRT